MVNTVVPVGFDPVLFARVNALGVKLGVSRAWVVRRACEEFCKKEGV